MGRCSGHGRAVLSKVCGADQLRDSFGPEVDPAVRAPHGRWNTDASATPGALLHEATGGIDGLLGNSGLRSTPRTRDGELQRPGGTRPAAARAYRRYAGPLCGELLTEPVVGVGLQPSACGADHGSVEEERICLASPARRGIVPTSQDLCGYRFRDESFFAPARRTRQIREIRLGGLAPLVVGPAITFGRSLSEAQRPPPHRERALEPRPRSGDHHGRYSSSWLAGKASCSMAPSSPRGDLVE